MTRAELLNERWKLAVQENMIKGLRLKDENTIALFYMQWEDAEKENEWIDWWSSLTAEEKAEWHKLHAKVESDKASEQKFNEDIGFLERLTDLGGKREGRAIAEREMWAQGAYGDYSDTLYVPPTNDVDYRKQRKVWGTY